MTTSTPAGLDALIDQQTAAAAATAAATEELNAAKAARGDATVAGTLTDAHSTRVLAARERLEVCTETAHALTRRRRLMGDEAPPATTSAGDSRTIRVRVLGRPGVHSCTQPSTHRALLGGEELTLPADDAVALATGGHVSVAEEPLPSWWPRRISAYYDDGALRALAGR